MNDLSWETNLSYELSEEEKATGPVFQAEAARLQAGDGRTYIRAGRVVRQRVRSATQPQALRSPPPVPGVVLPAPARTRASRGHERPHMGCPARPGPRRHAFACYLACPEFNSPARRAGCRNGRTRTPVLCCCLLLQRCNADRVCIDGFDPMDDGSIFMMMIRPWRRLGSDQSDALPACRLAEQSTRKHRRPRWTCTGCHAQCRAWTLVAWPTWLPTQSAVLLLHVPQRHCYVRSTYGCSVHERTYVWIYIYLQWIY